MPRFGLHRFPYYPQLSLLCSDEPFVKVLSALLFLSSQDKSHDFAKARDVHHLALHLGLKPEEVFEVFDRLILMGILEHGREVRLKKKDKTRLLKGEILPDEYEARLFLKLSFKRLKERLAECGLELSLKLLQHAADDRLDFLTIISERSLPCMQKLVGCACGEAYERCAFTCAKIAAYTAAHDEALAEKAIAPGWQLLLQPALNSQESEEEIAKAVAARWCRDGERAIDLCFADGSFFMCDGNFIKRPEQVILHGGTSPESRMLAAACLLGLSAVCQDLTYISDLSLFEVKKALAYLEKASGLKTKLSYAYFLHHEGAADAARKAYERYLLEKN